MNLNTISFELVKSELRQVKEGNKLRNRKFWLCKCFCGREKWISEYNLKTTKSCGCLRKVYPKGEKTTPEFNSWRSMKARCSPNNKDYRKKNYYNKGIKVCEQWLNNYWQFLNDMGRKPSRYHTLDRIDSDKDYNPDNCRWATYKEQSRNTSRARLITVDGVTKNLSAWSEISGISPRAICYRIQSGWSTQDAVFKPLKAGHRFLTIDGRTQCVAAWAKEYDIEYSTVLQRLRRGMSPEEAVKNKPETRGLVMDFSKVFKEDHTITQAMYEFIKNKGLIDEFKVCYPNLLFEFRV